MNKEQIERLLDTLDRLANSIDKIEDDIINISLLLATYLGIFFAVFLFFTYLLV